MNRIKELLQQLFRGISKAVFRFPLTVLSLTGAAVLICYTIGINYSPSLLIEKLIFTFMTGAFLGIAAQFAVERIEKLSRARTAVYLISALLTAGYFFIIWPAPEISAEITVRTLVAVFALTCVALWLPSYKNKADFNQICLIHFKSVFTSVLYSGVLTGGLAAIITTVNILLFNVNNDAYAYMAAIVWVMFAPLYYLSLLPKFNSEEESDLERLRSAQNYPKFLEILVSYIAIPLVTAYTLVLFIYFIKILVTLHWPSGQLGPMVLLYSAAGLVIFILASLLENRFAVLYRRFFPKVLIPVVIMQMISVAIRLNAYGITESRYYVALFGIFSIVIGLLTSFRPVSKNSIIALLAAAFAIFSVIPPMDAFTVSRTSQINRVEKILQYEGILAGNELTPKEDVSEEVKIEVTNILSYLDRSSSLKYIKWLPEEFAIYRDMEKILGFKPAYPSSFHNDRYFHASLDGQEPLIISGYDISMTIYSGRFQKGNEQDSYEFHLNGTDYVLQVNRLSKEEVRISVNDQTGTEIVSTDLYKYAKGLMAASTESRGAIPPEKMTIEVTENGYKMKVIFQNVNITLGTEDDNGADYSLIILFGTK